MSNSAKKIGLALGGGGPKGLAHIGVIKALRENGIPIDMIAGTSAGALIGGLYASLGSAEEVQKIADTLTRNDITKLFSDVGFPSGLIRGNKIELFLDKIVKRQTIESLKVPFTAVATELSTGQTVAIKTGSVAKGIRASCALPALFDAVFYQDKYLVDGAVSSPVPVKIVREMGASTVIAVNLEVYRLPQIDTPSIKPKISVTGFAAIRMLIYNLAQEQIKDADIVIVPDVSAVSPINMMQFIEGDEIIKKGYDAAIKAVPDILKII